MDGVTEVKKWLLIGMTLLIVLSGVLVGSSCGESKQESPTGVIAGVIKVPEGPEIKVVFDGPPELKVTWEKLGMEGFQLHLVGTLENVSAQTVSFEEIAFLVDGNHVGRWPSSGSQTLDPGEKAKFEQGIVDYSETSKIIEVRIKGFMKIKESVTTPPEPTPEPEGDVFTKAPETPQNPAEVVAAYAFLCDKGDYSEAEKLCTEHFIRNRGEPERYWGKISSGVPLSRVVITYVAKGKYRVNLRAIFYFSGGGTFISSRWLVNEDGKWKLYD